ncbi:MAG: hypothetical protein C7B45_01510 [Sulfobacillus acidophilus]|uniref:Enoyl-CoA hydratase n=1 Tax=Sulfobacillus acidophilus TaxID=53633 RepID=A0A2T2WNA7_9FIRM|nr:MAG: hypothetical protein C7B45_01510 [Sulfobacillus acidophilus]
MAETHLVVEIRGRVCWVTLNRPEKLNALNAAVIASLGTVIDEVTSRPDMRVLVITGQGERAFCAGADLDELHDIDLGQALKFLQRGQMVFQRLAELPIPTIAAINGVALGGGLELALACSIRLVSDNANLGFPEGRLGMIPAFGGTQRLPRLIGLARATEILLTGRFVGATEAQAIGLATAVHPQAELWRATDQLARQLEDKSPISMEMILTALRGGADADVSQGLLLERLAGAAAASSHDQREGVEAFQKKRKPLFQGWRTQDEGE